MLNHILKHKLAAMWVVESDLRFRNLWGQSKNKKTLRNEKSVDVTVFRLLRENNLLTYWISKHYAMHAFNVIVISPIRRQKCDLRSVLSHIKPRTISLNQILWQCYVYMAYLLRLSTSWRAGWLGLSPLYVIRMRDKSTLEIKRDI